MSSHSTPPVIQGNDAVTEDPTKFPKDKLKLVYLVMGFQGVGVLISWNMFITAKDYFVDFKLKGSPFQSRYLLYVGYASQLPNIIFNWVNVFIVCRGDLASRIVGMLMVQVLIFVLTIILAALDSSEWTATFFWTTMTSILILNGCNAVYQNSIFGLAGQLPAKYTGAVMIGTNSCGTFVVLLAASTTAIENKQLSAMIYFISGAVVLFANMLTILYVLPRNRFYRYLEVTAISRLIRHDEGEKKVPYLDVLKQCWVQLYNVWLVFFVSLAVFPTVHSDIKPVQEGFLGKHFMLVTCFLTFNLTALIGNITATYFVWPPRRWLALFTTCRLVFIPLFLLCNYHPLGYDRVLLVLINNDWIYWMLAILLGWSSGHLSSLAMMYVGANVVPEYQSKAGMFGAAMLVTGIFTGITFSGLCPLLIGRHKGP